MTAEEISKRLHLEPLEIEGGYYRETYRCDDTIPADALPPRYGGPRSCGTAIYYLLAPGTCSRLHRLKSDEVFHFLLGDPVTMLQLHPGGSSRTLTLGQDIAAGQCVQVVVPRGVWQGCLLNEPGRFALMGVTVAPGFEYADYEAGRRQELIRQYPDREDLIVRLTAERP
jgi:predicted cupin superfamily sugar epimerase